MTNVLGISIREFFKRVFQNLNFLMTEARQIKFSEQVM